MRYVEPATLEEALRCLAAEEDARCLAGGATLVAMMNADLVSPSTLVGLRRIPGLAGVEADGDGWRIGALTTHADIAADRRLRGAAEVVRSAAGQIAHPAIRNVGTIGGALCHADPAADFPTALLAAGARVEVAGLHGTRTVALDDLFVDYLETSLARGEILTSVRVPAGPPGARGRHVKLARVDGDYATVSVAAVIVREGGRCSYARVAVGAVGPVPLHLDDADAALVGSALSPADCERAAALLAEAADPVDDVRGSAEYRRRMIAPLLRRAVAPAPEETV